MCLTRDGSWARAGRDWTGHEGAAALRSQSSGEPGVRHEVIRGQVGSEDLSLLGLDREVCRCLEEGWGAGRGQVSSQGEWRGFGYAEAGESRKPRGEGCE